MACHLLFFDNDKNDIQNIGGFIARFKTSSPRKNYSSSSSSSSSYSRNEEKLRIKNLIINEFNNQIKKALDRIFIGKSENFKILNKNLNLKGTFVADGKTYLTVFESKQLAISRSDLSDIYNWSTDIFLKDEAKGVDPIQLENINIDIVALDAKETEKQAHFSTLLPSVIDEIFKKVGLTSTLKRTTTLKEREDLFTKISGVVKMNDVDYYEAVFSVTSKDKVDINDLKNIKNWNIILDVTESKKQNPKLFENNKNVDFSDYKTALSSVSSYFYK